MRTLFAACLILLGSKLWAATYIYRVPILLGKNATKILGDSVGKSGRDQPFDGTYVLTPPDTNYLLLKVTADNNPVFDITQGFNLFQIQKITDDGFIVPAIDNSRIFPVDIDWKVRVSSK